MTEFGISPSKKYYCQFCRTYTHFVVYRQGEIILQCSCAECGVMQDYWFVNRNESPVHTGPGVPRSPKDVAIKLRALRQIVIKDPFRGYQGSLEGFLKFLGGDMSGTLDDAIKYLETGD